MVNLIGLFLASLFFFAALSAFSQDARLIQAAKKEGGKVVVYGSLEADTVEAIKKAFQKKTGIEMDYWRASATKVMDRALSEYRAGKPLFDAVTTITDAMEIVLKEGIFAKYAIGQGLPKGGDPPATGSEVSRRHHRYPLQHKHVQQISF